jgi:hypothetical protein
VSAERRSVGRATPGTQWSAIAQKSVHGRTGHKATGRQGRTKACRRRPPQRHSVDSRRPVLVAAPEAGRSESNVARQLPLLVLLLVTFAGCVPVVYQGYTPYEGRVVDSASGAPLEGVHVLACLLDRRPGTQMESCASAGWSKETITDSSGRFALERSRHVGVHMLLMTDAGPGPYDTNLRFELKGYVPRELDHWRDRETLKEEPLVVELEASEVCAPPPITSEKHAVCLARQEFEREWPRVNWQTLRPAATKENGSWLVQFIDIRLGLRGGGGELTLDSASGTVLRCLGYR